MYFPALQTHSHDEESIILFIINNNLTRFQWHTMYLISSCISTAYQIATTFCNSMCFS